VVVELDLVEKCNEAARSDAFVVYQHLEAMDRKIYGQCLVCRILPLFTQPQGPEAPQSVFYLAQHESRLTKIRVWSLDSYGLGVFRECGESATSGF
jgi:hypothetical protein